MGGGEEVDEGAEDHERDGVPGCGDDAFGEVADEEGSG